MIGKSGAGKSALGNYLFAGKPAFAAGAGLPVTGWADNFKSAEFEHDGVPLRVFDSVGLEVGNIRDWTARFTKFLDARMDPATPESWVMGVFYVVNANAARFELVEAQVAQLVVRKGLPIQFVLTNCDVASEDKVAGVEHAIRSMAGFMSVPITRVGSRTVTLRSGESKSAFGREDVLKVFIQESRRLMGPRVADAIGRCLAARLENLRQLVREGFKEGKARSDELAAPIDSVLGWLGNYHMLSQTVDPRGPGGPGLDEVIGGEIERLSTEVAGRLSGLAEQLLAPGTAGEKIELLAKSVGTLGEVRSALDEFLLLQSRKLQDRAYLDNLLQWTTAATQLGLPAGGLLWAIERSRR